MRQAAEVMRARSVILVACALFLAVGGKAVTKGNLQLIEFPGSFVMLRRMEGGPSGASEGSTLDHFGFMVKDMQDAVARVMLAFAGEERGLLGSEHYTGAPAVPLDRTLAMLNLDMIGRARGQVEIGGLEAARSLADDVEAVRDLLLPSFGIATSITTPVLPIQVEMTSDTGSI